MPRKLSEYDSTWFENQTLLGLTLKIMGAFFALVVVISIAGFLFGWFNAAKDVVSPFNVRTQFHDAYSRYESLQATACNVQQAQRAYDASTDPNVKPQLQQQVFAYAQNYRRVAAEYNAAYDNAFEAKHVGPRDLPRVAPSLTEAEANC